MATTKLPPRATTSTGNLAARIKPVAAKSEKRAPSAPGVTFTPIPKELTKLYKLKNSPGGLFALKLANKVKANAKRIAPISARGSHGRKSGYLRARIGTYVGENADGMWVDVVTRAKDKRGNYYGRIQNQRKHYLERALNETKG